MIKDFTNFEKGVKESLTDFEMPYDSSQWQKLEMKLEGRSASSLNTMAAAVVTALIFLSGISYVVINSQEEQKEGSSQFVDGSINRPDANDDSSIVPFEEESKQENILANNDETTSIDIPNIEADVDIEDALVEKVVTAKSTDLTSENNSETPIENTEIIVEDDSPNESDVVESTEVLLEDKVLDMSPSIKSSSQQVCAGEKIEFSAQNIPDNSKFLWNFGNADFATEANPVRTFNEPGEYNVSLILSKFSRKIESSIIVLPRPIADIDWYERSKGQIRLSNLSDKISNSYWKVDGDYESTEENPIYDYSEAGERLVYLKVENEFGCTDSMFKYVDLKSPIDLMASDEVVQGESFKPVMSNPEDGIMGLRIHNLRNQLIYESETGKAWDGKMPDGTYPASGSEFAWIAWVKNSSGKEIYRGSGKFKIIP